MAANQFENKDVLVFSELNGMDTQSDRYDLQEKKASWMENLQPIGPNNLLAVPSPNNALLLLAGETITEQFNAYFNGINYLICFCLSGAAYGVNISTGSHVKFANAGTFSSSSADATVWNLQRILIADPTAGYCTWDGTVFVKYGGVSPNVTVTAGGSGYTGGATVSYTTSGSGTGAAFSATVVAGVVTKVTLTNAGTGFASGDTITLTINAVSGGSGATATARPWPKVTPNPVTIAVFQGRVWFAANNVLTYTGTGASTGGVGYDDFNSGDASGSFTITDSDLVSRITALRNLNNYLFIFGDNSVKQIGNISVSSSITNFTLVTLSSDQGTTFKNTIVSYNRVVTFANTVGVYAVFGTSVQKISDEMDGIFRSIDFTYVPSSALNDINNIHCYLLLVKYDDPITGARSLILGFMNKKWFVISQGNFLTYITTAIVNGVTETYGTSGNDITQLLQNTSVPVNIKLQTSLTSHGAPYLAKRTSRWAIAQKAAATDTLTLTIETDRSDQVISYTISNAITFIGAGGVPITFTGYSGLPITFYSLGVFQYATGNTGGVGGIYLGMTLTGEVLSYKFNSFMLEYGEGAAFANTGVQVSNS